MTLHRAVKLENGMIFSVNTKDKLMNLEFENDQFYEVIEDGYDQFGQVKWKRSGEVYTSEQINELTK